VQSFLAPKASECRGRVQSFLAPKASECRWTVQFSAGLMRRERDLSDLAAAAPLAVAGDRLTIEQVERVARGGAPVTLTSRAHRRLQAATRALERAVRRGRPVYGLSTGVGALEVERSAPGGVEEQQLRQRRLLESHACGVGAPMRDDQVRAMMLARANALAAGRSGVRAEAVLALLGLVNRGVTPLCPAVGSLGASDLAPLAHMALVLGGVGQARHCGEVLPAGEALRRAGLSPIELAGRDALGLMNGLGQTAGLGALVVADGWRLLAAAEAAAALSLLASGAPRDFLDPRLARAKRHAGQAQSADRLRALTAGAVAPRGPLLRADLCFRYAPQVAGAARSALAFARRAVETELCAAVDNPLVFPDGWICSNSGATSGQEVAQALDLLAISVTSLAVIAERRIGALLDPARSGGLPPFLRAPGAADGADPGLMVCQYTAAALVAELRLRAAPASVQSIPVCADREDHASMSALAAQKAAWSIEQVETVVAIELLCARRALALLDLAPPRPLAALCDALDDAAPFRRSSRPLGEEIAAVRRLLEGGALPMGESAR
jgi:histidine ammonia-lyase